MRTYCINCGESRKGSELRCLKCNGIFNMEPDFKYRDAYEENYPYIRQMISLGEVVTPILDFDAVSVKLEYFSPTFSYKDRGSKTLVSALAERYVKPGETEINEDSSGNAGASIAAYGKRAGFNVNIFVPENTIKGKISQIESYGARIVPVKGGRERVAEAARMNSGVYASHVINPEFRDGIRELAYEIFRQGNGKVPDNIFIPVSAGTLLIGMYSGFHHLMESGEIEKVPSIIAVQTEAVSPLCSSVNNTPYDPDNSIESVADALVSRTPPLLDLMSGIIKENGRCITVSEQSIIGARKNLALMGIYAEYSSATVLAAFSLSHFDGRSLLVITGNGLKTP
ncbi:MAG: pyridoxal-phosphate dependent enzyme [Candidatus Thermoplasmatota archaeon]|jgi:threonine synthase|nr:pyridoxal-phosphate dependent enzyme [Candidatus Thermoplasmatota archaeon]